MWVRKNLTFKNNLGLVFYILPLISAIDNKISLICSILFGKSKYTIQNKKFKLDDLVDLLKRNGFKCSIFRNQEFGRTSNRIGGTIYATKV